MTLKKARSHATVKSMNLIYERESRGVALAYHTPTPALKFMTTPYAVRIPRGIAISSQNDDFRT